MRFQMMCLRNCITFNLYIRNIILKADDKKKTSTKISENKK